MHPPVGYTIAPLQGLPVQVGRVGEAHTGPHIAPGVLDPALHLALGLGPVGPAQPQHHHATLQPLRHSPVDVTGDRSSFDPRLSLGNLAPEATAGVK